jgi:multidrug efflux pump
MGPLELTELINRVVKPRLQTVPGVADVQVGGDRRYAMRIWLDADKLAGYRLTVQDVEDALAAPEPGGAGRPHRKQPARIQRHRAHRSEHRGAVQRDRAEDHRRLHRALRDVARIEQAAANERSRVRLNGVPSISTGIIRNATANPLDVAAGVKALMPQIQRDLPPA